MLELDVHNERGEVTGKVEFDDSILGESLRPRLLHQVVVAYMANKRFGTASAKTRAEAKGSGKKLWRQKGTGRARVGDRRAPIRVGGGVAHPPKPRSFRQKLTKSMRRQALRSALLAKFRDNEVLVIDPPELDAPKTKRVAGMLKALGLDTSDRGSCLLLTRQADSNLWKSSRNVPHLRTMPMQNLNALDVLSHGRLVLTREAVENFAEVFR
jgi:large subunit ribosomal protein L4